MTGATHKIIALKAMEHFEIEEKQKKEFLRGNVMADYLPFYNYKQHYPRQSMEYVLDKNKTIDSLFELGVLSHFVSDFLCTPHFNHWRLYSTNGAKHILFERKLERVAQRFDFCPVEVEPSGWRKGCINDKVLGLYENAGESYYDNLKSAYVAVIFMLENFVRQL